ncbi:DUF309 domain-containing protein [Rubeoparvulum massiliense]|uniref:DUF309 domain-containing protein n=1 Tax=Rubeoparvulum massiliense TaxID=1631346 RepID=UPI00065E94BD|nr:DUF309 domain-containing protein [Rubeoparvulum massiliense]
MAWPQAWVDYLVHFQYTGDYFECHEILEAYWKEEQDENWRPVWVAWIQLAVALYHHRRGNFHGAQKLLKKVVPIFRKPKVQGQLQQLGVAAQALCQEVEGRLQGLEHGEVYRPLQLQIEDVSLLQACKERAMAWGVVDMTGKEGVPESIQEKHRLRDRSDILRERAEAWEARHGTSLYPRKGM